MARSGQPFGFSAGVGLVTSNMIGAGVFLSAGYMAQGMGPGPILLAWVVGGVIALAGARAYATMALTIPRSGGEYRYLHDLLHPFLGYLSGWFSLLIGFSAPVAIDALAAGAFAHALVPGIKPGWFGAALVVVLTVVHAMNLRSSRMVQRALSGLNILLVVGFAVAGLTLGSAAWPDWSPPQASAGFPLAAFMGSLFYIAFAFSGWNAATYVAEEFREPKRDVPRATLAACAIVGVLYLIVNWVFVANLRPEAATVVFRYEAERVTLGHLIMQGVLGEIGGTVMSAITLVVFISAASVMMLVGPRIYAAMASDGLLPKAFAARAGRPPVGSVVLQGAIALVLLHTHDLQEVLSNTGALLTLFSALCASTLFRIRFARPDLPRPSGISLAAAGVHVLSACWMLYFGFRNSLTLVLWISVIAAIAAVAYVLTVRRGRLGGRKGPS
jgi:basic amino acid/polyamine antiporter, APA family